MRIHVVQHVEFEGPGAISRWAQWRGHTITTWFAPSEEYPEPTDVDLLVVMGGPMCAGDDSASPWLVPERHFVASVIAAGRPALGVCLGAQILARVIGGTVRRNERPEIGWFPVERTAEGEEEPIFSAWDEPMTVGHWHGDTFDLLEGMEPSLSSVACANQAFVFDGRVVGLQFHLEWTEADVDVLLSECAADLEAPGDYVMDAQAFRAAAAAAMTDCHERLFALLDHLEALGPGLAGDGAV